jgi:hypothetical protein
MDAPAPTPAPTSSVAASCYPSPPVDNSIDIEESIDVDDDSDELGTDTQDIRSGGGGGRPPLPRNKRRRNVRKTFVVWNILLGIQIVLKINLWHIVIIVGLSINVMERTMAPLTCCTMSKHANSTRTY